MSTTWTVITNSTPNTGSYNWFIPNTPSTTARVGSQTRATRC
ncbi:MAG: hypothetical protein U0176_13100 [Bacteroidia bacterium]